MNRVLKSVSVAAVAIFSVCVVSWQLHAAVVNITQGSTSGYTMTSGNTYVVKNSVTFSNSTAGGSGMSVADNATAVLYIPAGVTLTARGANGSGRTGGGAGIRVPQSATLIITGVGTVNAFGGSAGNGGNGADGANGSGTDYGSSGSGGAGGIGGGGAGAAIGGFGGMGGEVGEGAKYIVLGANEYYKNGNDGNAGSPGLISDSMGNVYFLGCISIATQSGMAGTGGKAGAFGKRKYYRNSGDWKWSYGGGGGGGASPLCSIGAGGQGGGGGGGGGSGAIIHRAWTQDDSGINTHGGGGHGGLSGIAAGGTGSAQVSDAGYQGGAGGAGGGVGSEGGQGIIYVSPSVSLDVNREYVSALTHPAAQYIISFNPNGGEIVSSVSSAIATLGCALPDCIPSPTSPKKGYAIKGWMTEEDGGDMVYNEFGEPLLDAYTNTTPIVLYAQWGLDPAQSVFPDNPFWLRENEEIGWFVEYEDDGEPIIRSGEIGNNTNSWMETTIVGPLSFSFEWKVSCNTRGHYLAWFIDGVEQARIRGETDWATVAASIPDGEHVVRFDYVKGSTAGVGEDKGQIRNFNIAPRIQTDAMQVMWDWTTNYLVSVATTGFGTSDFEGGWIADGSNVVVTISPTIHSYSIALSGDTEGAVLDGTNLTFQVCGAARSIAVSIDEVKPHLVVASEHGIPTPTVGEHLYSSDAEVTVSVAAPAAVDGVRAICTGWTGAGSVPAFGETSSATFVITEDSSITWNWTTGYWVEFSIVGKGTTSYEAQWVVDGTNLVIPFSVNTPFYSLSLSGDADEAVLGEDNITVPISAPRSIVLTVTEYTYEAVLDGRRLSWSSGGAASWVPQAEVSYDGQDAVKSGEVTGDNVSTLSTSVTGPGTLSWWWKLDVSDCAGVDVFVDGALVESLDSVSDWVAASIDIVGDGEHAVRFEFWNAGTAATISDCAYLDQMSWTAKGGDADHTVTTPEEVPYSYFDNDYPSLLAEHGGDYEAAALATAANGHNKVWECFVAGISPTNATSVFTAKINMVDGAPVVSWEPDLNTNGVIRAYKVYGKETLEGGGEWQYPTNSLHRFFKVDVEMP